LGLGCFELLLLIDPQVLGMILDIVIVVPEDSVEDPCQACLDLQTQLVAVDEEVY
jgi:hypothetical protein